MNNEDEAQKLADIIEKDTKIGASSPGYYTQGDDRQFEDIVKAVEILVGNQNKRYTPALDDKNEAPQAVEEVVQAVEDNIATHNEVWAIDQILEEDKNPHLQDALHDTSSPQMTVLELMIREALPDLLKDWMDNNMEAIAAEMIRRDALHDAVAKVWSKEMKNSS